MKSILFEPGNDKRFYKNNLFNDNYEGILLYYKLLRKKLAEYNVNLNTIDMGNIKTADKLIFLDFCPSIILKYLTQFSSLNEFKKKSILIIAECPVIKKENWIKLFHNFFSIIYVWDDSLVDNKKYFKYQLPQTPTYLKYPAFPFKKKKLLTLINAYKLAFAKNELYSKRIDAIRYFERYHPKNFDLYGKGWGKGLNIKYAYYLKDNVFGLYRFIKEYFIGRNGFPSYRGELHEKEKISTFSRYKFALCFENMTGVNGYITEKIFDCFKAKCVPVYWGASNIKKYIPTNIFIDYRKFMDYEQLYRFLTNMSEKTYNEYVSNIIRFLYSRQFKKWLPDYFAKNVMLKL